jgi:hypothetical protein
LLDGVKDGGAGVPPAILGSHYYPVLRAH